MTFNVDDITCRVVSGGKLWIDGGAMFGVVPRVLWQRFCPPDDANRILLDTHCLLARIGGRNVLIDTGYGPKATDRDRRNYALDAGNPIVDNLAAIGVAPDDIDVVLLTHLHFDHAGGCTRLDDAGRPAPQFPNARHVVQRIEWDDAVEGMPELAGSYFENDFDPLQKAGLVDFVEGDAELMPGLSVRLAPGHTRGHQIAVIGSGDSGGRKAIYLGDLCPFAAHMRTQWSMAYDQFPLQQRRVKPIVLGEAADAGHTVIFDHDPQVIAATVSRDPGRDFVVRDVITG